MYRLEIFLNGDITIFVVGFWDITRLNDHLERIIINLFGFISIH